jgi:hypothetical protein
MTRLVAFAILLFALAAPLSGARADTAGRLTLEIQRFVKTALRNAPTHYDALRGADLHWSGSKHYHAKYPLGEFMNFCQVAGNGADASMECSTVSFTGGEDASQPTVIAAIRGALPSGFVSATPGTMVQARWENADEALAVELLADVSDDGSSVSYAIWISPLTR